SRRSSVELVMHSLERRGPGTKRFKRIPANVSIDEYIYRLLWTRPGGRTEHEAIQKEVVNGRPINCRCETAVGSAIVVPQPRCSANVTARSGYAYRQPEAECVAGAEVLARRERQVDCAKYGVVKSATAAGLIVNLA